MAGRPPKTAAVIKAEGKSHRTKQELAIREAGEQANLTGTKIKETDEIKEDPVAHAEFLRLKKLLTKIEKNDEIYGAATRRYCICKSRLASTEESILRLQADLDELKDSKSDFDSNMPEYYRLVLKMEDTIVKKEQLAKSYRAEMTDYEKENCMTIKSSLRVIPKKPETKTNALKEALMG